MAKIKLILTSLIKAAEILDEALVEYDSDPSNSFVRDACIQRFEYCYDLASKFIRRHLEQVVDTPNEIDRLSFQDMIRMAFEKGLLKSSWDQWWRYRDNRNATSHGYNEKRANEVVSSLNDFNQELLYLLKVLKEEHGS